MSSIKKLIEVDRSLVTKLKVLSAFENLSVKALMEKAIEEFVHKKELERIEGLSDEEKEDLGLLLLMQHSTSARNYVNVKFERIDKH